MLSRSVLLVPSLLALAVVRPISPNPLVGNGSPFPTDTTEPHKFPQILDHFKVATDNSTWNQRYWVKSSHYEAGGPVFLLLGGCYETRDEDLDSAIAGYAKQHKAMMIELEHRYYGDSQPSQSLDIGNMDHLSSLQALADVAFFRQSMVAELSLPEDARWVLFGCGYGGSLAAWARFRYPHLVHGAVASSAPLQASVQIPDFLNNLETVLGHDCAGNIKDAYSKLFSMITKKRKDKMAFDKMLEKFGICAESTLIPEEVTTRAMYTVELRRRRSPEERERVEETPPVSLNDKLVILNLFNGIFNAIQNGYRDRTNQKVTVERFCEAMSSSETNAKDILDRYAEAHSSITNRVETEACVRYTRATGIDEQERQRIYQACTEFGHFPVVAAGGLLADLEITAEDYQTLCSDLVGFNNIESAANRTNMEYGGSALRVSRVVFVQGGDDPGRALGMADETNPESPVINIEGAFRCWDLHKASESDSQSLQDARTIISETIGSWLTMTSPPGGTADRFQESGGFDWTFWIIVIVVAVVVLAAIGLVVLYKLKSEESLRL